VFEGIDGAGTTTQLKRLGNFFKKEELVTTAEPTDRETGLFLRKMLKGELDFSPRTAAYLFAADRAEHLYGKGGIIENTEKGMFVVSDRYIFSSLAYQSISCGEELPRLLNSPFPLPEILFYFENTLYKSISSLLFKFLASSLPKNTLVTLLIVFHSFSVFLYKMSSHFKNKYAAKTCDAIL